MVRVSYFSMTLIKSRVWAHECISILQVYQPGRLSVLKNGSKVLPNFSGSLSCKSDAPNGKLARCRIRVVGPVQAVIVYD